MGLDMYLKRANLHGYTPQQAEAATSYYSMMKHNEENPDNQHTDFEKWSGIDERLLDMGAVEALRAEYQPRFFHWDVKKMFPMPDIFEQVGYWRKANAIHSWFVAEVQNDVDDCGTYIVSREQLEDLKWACEVVLSGEQKPEDFLPVEDGAFFGSQEYDESYFQDLRDTIEIINKVIAETDWDVQTVCYEASW